MIEGVTKRLESISVIEVLSALDAKQWIKAHETGYNEMMRNHVWEIDDRPYGVYILKNK